MVASKRQQQQQQSDQVDHVAKRTRSSKNASHQKASNQKASKNKLHRTGNLIVKAPSKVGHVYVFGTGDTGQLGLTMDMLERKRPMPLESLKDQHIVDVVCGGMHSIAITKEGKLWSWGCNDHFALGRAGDEYTPSPVEHLDDIKVIKVACSDSLTMALSEEGQLYCWGTFRSNDGLLGFSITKKVQEQPALFEPLKEMVITDIAAGADHCLALARSGRVFVWGNSQQYQLGRRVLSRHLANGLRPEALNLKNIKMIGSGSYHSFAVSRENVLYAWGLNNFQQCGLDNKDDGGHGKSSSSTTHFIVKPTVVTALKGKGTIKSVHGGEHHSLVLMEDGTVYAFGRADSGQLGLSADVIDTMKSTEEEEDASLFKKAVGTPTQIAGLDDMKDIASGTNHSLALDSTGTAYTWGFGECYALGNGSSDDEETPIKLTGQKLDGHKVLRVSAGAQHSLILASVL